MANILEKGLSYWKNKDSVEIYWKFDLHTKRCNLYYKYIIETVFGFKCQFCPFEFTTKVKSKVDPR